MLDVIATVLRIVGPHLRRDQAQLIILGVCVLGGAVAQLAGPRLLQWAIDAALAGVSRRMVVGIIVSYGVIAVTRHLLTIIVDLLANRLAWRGTNGIRSKMFDSYVTSNFLDVQGIPSGSLLERVDGDSAALSRFISHMFAQVISNGVIIAGVIVLVFLQHVALGAVALTTLLGVAAALRVTWKIGNRHWRGARLAATRFYGRLSEVYAGAHDIRAIGDSGHYIDGLSAAGIPPLKWERRAVGTESAMSGSITVVTTLAKSIGLLLCFFLVIRGELTAGAVLSFAFYLGMIAGPIERITEEAGDFQKAGAAGQRIEAWLQRDAAPVGGGDR